MAVALLAGCGGSQPPIGTSGASDADRSLPDHKTYSYTGKPQSFIVPPGVTKLTVVAHGGRGGGRRAGWGGRLYAIIPVKPGETLAVFVGGHSSYIGVPGYNGGGKGGVGYYSSGYLGGYGGGGASDVREGGDRLANRVLVAGGIGGDGGYGEYPGGRGGEAGGITGDAGGPGHGGPSSGIGGVGGSGGTQKHGGKGGSGGSHGDGDPGSNGARGQGGNGGNICYGSGNCVIAGGGGGGGGGYYGGGGGGEGGLGYGSGGGGGGGGGGSSYIEPSAIKFRMWSGWKHGTGDGLVVFSWQ